MPPRDQGQGGKGEGRAQRGSGDGEASKTAGEPGNANLGTEPSAGRTYEDEADEQGQGRLGGSAPRRPTPDRHGRTNISFLVGAVAHSHNPRCWIVLKFGTARWLTATFSDENRADVVRT